MSYFKNAFNQKSLIDDSSVYLESLVLALIS